MSHPTRGAWIETRRTSNQLNISASHPTRGAWIETGPASILSQSSAVAPHPGCVD